MVIWWRMLLVVARRADNLAKPPNAEVTTQDATRRGPWTPVSALTAAACGPPRRPDERRHRARQRVRLPVRPADRPRAVPRAPADPARGAKGGGTVGTSRLPPRGPDGPGTLIAPGIRHIHRGGPHTRNGAETTSGSVEVDSDRRVLTES